MIKADENQMEGLHPMGELQYKRKIRFYPVIPSIKFVSGLSRLGVRETLESDVSKTGSEKENMING
jgi:hypothetical protein